MAKLDINQREIIILAAGLGVGVLGGGSAGYFIAKKRLEMKFMLIAEQEISEMREHYAKAKAVVAEPKPELETLVTDLGYVGEPEEDDVVVEVEVVEESPEVIRNVFESNDWDYATEMRARDETRPYVIHIDEFVQGERDYEQTTLTYFADDDVLCDERDSVVDNRDELVGMENLERFGHGSGDPNTIYIRNPPLSLDIEIVRSEGNYAAEVHGFIEHSDSGRRARSRRGFDDDEYS